MTEEMYKRHRPQSPKELIGQAEAVAVIGGFLRTNTVPHVTLLTGPSGVGKTTIARMVANAMGCGAADLTEINAAQMRGIDYIRGLQQSVSMLPISGNVRVWVIDECHSLTRDAMEGFLKLLEDQPNHAYFFLCTTDPKKLLKTIITRSTEIVLKGISEKDLVTLISNIAAKENLTIEEEVVLKIASMSDGSARKALVLLQQIAAIPMKDQQLAALARSDATAPSRTLAQALMGKSTFDEVALILEAAKDEEPETMRRMVLGYATAVLLKSKGNHPKALKVLNSFQFDFYASGRAGLVLASYNVIHG